METFLFDVSPNEGLGEREQARRLLVLIITLRNIQVSGEPYDDMERFQNAWRRSRNVRTARKFNEVIGLDLAENPRLLNQDRLFVVEDFINPETHQPEPNNVVLRIPLPNRRLINVILSGMPRRLVEMLLEGEGRNLVQISRGVSAMQRAYAGEDGPQVLRDRSPGLEAEVELEAPDAVRRRLEDDQDRLQEVDLYERSTELDPDIPLLEQASGNPLFLQQRYPWYAVLGFSSERKIYPLVTRCVSDILRRDNMIPSEYMVQSFGRLFILGMRFAAKVISNYSFGLIGAHVTSDEFDEEQIHMGPANLTMFFMGVMVGIYCSLRSYRHFFIFRREFVYIFGDLHYDYYDEEPRVEEREEAKVFIPIPVTAINDDTANGLRQIILLCRSLFGQFVQRAQELTEGRVNYYNLEGVIGTFGRVALSLFGVDNAIIRSGQEYVTPAEMERYVRVLQLDQTFNPERDEYLNVNMQPVVRPNHQIMGDNAFWYYTFEGRGKGYYSSCAGNCIMFPTEIKGNKLEGCFSRALACTCLPTRKGNAVYCRCCEENNPDWDKVYMNMVRDYVLTRSLPVIVVSIHIPRRGSQDKKTFEVIVVSPTYYEQERRRVIFINDPEWERVSAHCCLWVNPPKPEQESAFEEFVRLGSFNELIHKICRCNESVCPICGLLYKKTEGHSHFRSHGNVISCVMCGLTFKTSEELDVHTEYHCKKIGVGASLDFSDESVKFCKKNDVVVPIVYADLESAIDDAGTHNNILCGWVKADQMIIHISTDIKEMFDAICEYGDEALIYFHNGEGYDFHFMILELSKLSHNIVKEFSIVCDSSEKIRYFSVKYKNCLFKFRDSFAFVSESLAKWVESSKRSNCPFTCFKKNFPEQQKQTAILQKNPFPYNAILSADHLKLPITKMIDWIFDDECEKLFCYKYTSDQLKLEIYPWFLIAKALFGWVTIGDYYKTYLACDVGQLCDCMEFFRDNVMAEFGLDVHAYYGTPSVTWAAWLQQNKYELEPVKEDMFDIINSSIRGGQTGAMTRYFDRDTIDEGCFMCDLDCNSLYATVMLKFKYPCHDFKYDSMEGVDKHNILQHLKSIHESGRSGFVEVDMLVFDKCEMRSYMPVASKRTLTGCYNYHAMACYAYGMGMDPDTLSFSGLVNVAGDHPHYCCHTRLLEFYIEHNFVEVKHVYRILTGVDEPVFRDYVHNNLEQRKLYSSDPIKKMLYKLLNNSLYGKTYEDITHRKDLQMVLTSTLDPQDPNVARVISQYGKWTLYEHRQREFFMNKPVYLGACITEYSKLWMYIFFYDKIRPKFPYADVYYTDTDALTIRFPPEYDWETGQMKPTVTSMMHLAEQLNTYEEQIIDTSNFDEPPTDRRHTEHNNEPGLFKSETGSASIIKMVALRAKTYIMVCERGVIKMSVKGCPMAEKTKLTFNDFYNVLMGDGVQKIINYGAIRSKFHIVKSVRLSRVVLSADDRKRYISEDKIHTLPLFGTKHNNSQTGLDLEKILSQ